MQCDVCHAEIASEDEATEHLGRTLCEDCYMDALSPAVACDPWAVYTATSTIAHQGHMPELTGLQQGIMKLIDEKGRVSPREVMDGFGLSEPEFKREVATLRHMELVRGSREDGQVFVRRFDDR